MIVQESLQNFRDDQHLEFILNGLNEGSFDLKRINELIGKLKNKSRAFSNLLQKLNSTSSKNVRKSIVMIMLALLFFSEGKKSVVPQIDKISDNIAAYQQPISSVEEFKELAKEKGRERAYQDILDKLKTNPSVIKDLNTINANRFSEKRIPYYDRFDDQIAEGIHELQAKGENPDPKVIKGLMMVETGMKPVKNRLGYEGFPQTKQGELDWVNDKFGTNFTMKDMYDVKESTKFIYYYLKLLSNLKHTANFGETLAAYNFGYGNLKKAKASNQRFPEETRDYIKLVSTISQS